jgi:hypothetical protein
MFIFFDKKGIAYKEFFLVGQAVNYAYYCDVLRDYVKMCGRLRPELWRQKNWLLHHDNAPSHTSLITREFFTKSNMAVVTHPPYFFQFP